MSELEREPLELHRAPQALRTAVETLSQDSGYPLANLDGQEMGSVFQLAVQTYGRESLPEFWRVWSDWNDAGDEPAPMGEL